MQGKQKRQLLSGGMILIVLGILVILHKTSGFGFDRSWPILLIVIGVGAIVQRGRDAGSWFITAAGIFLLLMQNRQMDIQALSRYVLPLLLVGVGANIIWKRLRKRDDRG